MPTSHSPPAEALGQSEPFLDFQERLSRVAPVDRPVLLIGERGTGKELAAHRLHFLSKRWEGPFVTLNCSTLTPSLIEAELFGHERGAFTGAESARVGRFEAASGGTLFLDEIGTIPMPAQEKILRVVEYGMFERVGSSRPVEVDVRIVCATNVNLMGLAERGEFKRDLLDRLSFEVIFLPPLRYRGEDIILLARYFAGRMAYELGIEREVSFGREALAALERHPWPGNVRELKNVIERAVYRSTDGRVEEIDFDPFVSPFAAAGEVVAPAAAAPLPAETGQAIDQAVELRKGFKEQVRDFEIRLVGLALERSRYNQRKAAALLNLSYNQFRSLWRKYQDEISM